MDIAKLGITCREVMSESTRNFGARRWELRRDGQYVGVTIDMELCAALEPNGAVARELQQRRNPPTSFGRLVKKGEPYPPQTKVKATSSAPKKRAKAG